MTIWTGKVTTEPTVKYPSMGRRSWRWMLTAERWRVTLERHILTKEDDWYPIGHYYGVGIQRRPRWAYDHGYYDGYHHAIHMGRLYVTWGG